MEENKNVTVHVENYEGFADLSPVGTFVFCILCFAFWAADLGMLGEGSLLAIGFLGLAVTVPYFIAAITLCRKGLILGGNTYTVFGAVFGACGGLFNTFGALFPQFGIPFNYSIVGIPFALGGLYLLLLLPAVIRVDKVNFFIFLFGALGCIGSGVTILGWLPESFNLFNGWALFLDGVVGFYCVIGTILNSFGLNLPMGKPFIAPKE